MKNLIVFFVFFCLHAALFAIPPTKNGDWNGSASGDWSTDGNWGTSVLGNQTTININGATYTNAPVVNSATSHTTLNLLNSGLLTCNADFSATTINVNSGSNLVVNGGTTTASGNLIIQSTSSVNLDGGTLRVDGTLTIQNGGLLAITNGTLDVANLSIADGGSLTATANSTINISGNWNNETSTASQGFTESTCTVNFDGTGAQSISHAGGTETFNNLSISNSGNTVSANCDLDILGDLNFTTTGYIDIGANDLKMVNWVDGRIPNLAVDRFVIANAASGGSFMVDGVDVGEFVPVPVGLASGSANFARVDLTNSDVGASEFSVNVCSSISDDGSCGGGALENDSVINITWNISSVSTDCGLTFYWDSSRELADVDRDSLAISHYKNGKWTWITDTVAASVYSGSVYRVSGVTDGFSPFGVGAADAAAGTEAPLPVELVSFQMEIVDVGVDLFWSTAAEINNSHFVVQRSKDGKEFIDVGRIEGAGTSTAARNYSYTDLNVAANVYYYRLKQVDFDGTFEYSKVLNYKRAVIQGVLDFDLYPNPINENQALNLRLSNLNSYSGLVEVRICDAMGNVLLVELFNLADATHQVLPIKFKSLSKGMYFATVVAGGVVLTKKLIVK